MAQERILVVDDEEVIRLLMVDILTDEGYQVETAENGQDALELIKDSGDFVVLFTDILMPQMDGIELIHEARKVCPSLIPIVMTGFGTLQSARAAVKEGAYDYVLKPFSLSDVRSAISLALERYHLENENVRLREATELLNISEKIASIRDEKKLLDFVLKAALERVNAARGSIMVTLPDGKALVVATSIGVPEEHNKTQVQVEKAISGWVVRNAKPLLVRDIRDHPELADLGHQLADTSFMSVPLERKSAPSKRPLSTEANQPHVIAVLNANEKKDATPFTEGDLKILSIIANHAAAAFENVRLIDALDDAHLATFESVALLLEAKDPYTHGHSERVREYSILIARRLGMSEDRIEVLRVGAALHDVGKMGIKDEILNKEGELTEEEWQEIRRHPVVGYEVLLPVRHLTKEHLQLVRGHHERMDGAGYPDGLAGDQLFPLTRIIVVADAYDAMASGRAYRSALPPEEITCELERNAGTQFDPEVARVFVELIRSGEVKPPTAENQKTET